MKKILPVLSAPSADSHIHVLRGRRVMLDSSLAALYGVETKAVNLAVRRNPERFPSDFMFQLSVEEAESLRFQSETSKPGRGGRRYSPYAFTQEGVAMLSGVLRSSRAVAVNIEIMRSFVRLRQLALSVKEVAAKLDALEKKYDSQFAMVFRAIKELMSPPPTAPEDEGVIGFLGRPKKGRAT